MDLYIVNASKHEGITMPLLHEIASALEFQLYQHVAPFWQISGVRVLAIASIESLPDRAGSSPLVIYDDPDQADVLGWHSYNSSEGMIHGTTFVRPILNNGGTLTKGPRSLSVTLSHEAIEAVIDPYVNMFSFLGDLETIEPVEACDRVQGDSYEIGGISVSNFLGPRAFRDGPGPYDWLRRLPGPWDLTPGGYCQRYNVRTGKHQILWGDLVPMWERELKLQKMYHKLSRLSRRPTKEIQS